MKEPSLSTKIVVFLSGFSGPTAYAFILGFLFLCGLGLPVPEDITLIAAGVLAALDNISLQGALISCFIGVMVGDMFLFFLGRRLGRRVFRLPIFRSIFNEERIRKAEEKIVRNSRFVCFTGRFLPGVRAPIFLMSGVLGVRPIVFLTLDGFAALISVPVWVLIGYWFGLNLQQAFKIAKDFQLTVFSILLLLIMGFFIRRFLRRRRERSLTPAETKKEI